MEEFLTVEALVIALVLLATLVAILVRRIRLPYTVSLVLVGLPAGSGAGRKDAPAPLPIVKHERWA
jgi:Kef-type K+ transport system membrane component KefB